MSYLRFKKTVKTYRQDDRLDEMWRWRGQGKVGFSGGATIKPEVETGEMRALVEEEQVNSMLMTTMRKIGTSSQFVKVKR